MDKIHTIHSKVHPSPLLWNRHGGNTRANTAWDYTRWVGNEGHSRLKQRLRKYTEMTGEAASGPGGCSFTCNATLALALLLPSSTLPLHTRLFTWGPSGTSNHSWVLSPPILSVLVREPPCILQVKFKTSVISDSPSEHTVLQQFALMLLQNGPESFLET